MVSAILYQAVSSPDVFFSMLDIVSVILRRGFNILEFTYQFIYVFVCNFLDVINVTMRLV